MAIQIGETILGRFQVITMLGRGGFGSAYLAEDRKLERRVVVKELQSGYLSSDQWQRRFINEARIMAKLNHPNIVSIYELYDPSTDPVSDCLIVMEYMSGGSLENLLNRDSILPIKESIRIAAGVLKALCRAHDAGVIHRDIKPGNILLSGDGTEVKLSDFGIAHMPDLNLTTGVQPGTLKYLSPEQAGNKNVDARCDLYAVGVLLYEILTKRFYLDFSESVRRIENKHLKGKSGENMQRINMAVEGEIRKLILKESPIPPVRYRKDIPPELDDIIIKSLAKKPENRFQSARQMLSAIEKAMSLGGNNVKDISIPELGLLPIIERSDNVIREIPEISIRPAGPAPGKMIWPEPPPAPSASEKGAEENEEEREYKKWRQEQEEERLRNKARWAAEDRNSRLCFMKANQVFTIENRGLFMMGKINKPVKVGDKVRIVAPGAIMPRPTVTHIEAIDDLSKSIDHAEPGQYVGIRIHGMLMNEVKVGSMLMKVEEKI